MGQLEGMCPNCMCLFMPNNSRQIFCCRRCSDSYRHRAKRRLKEAKESGDEKIYHRLWQSFYRYHKPIDGYPEIACLGCGTIFRPITSKQQYCCKSCGDKKRRKDPARKEMYKKNQARYSSKSVEHFIGRLLHKKSRGELDIKYLMGIYNSQKGKCALSGIPMTHIAGHGRIATNISIDRIDSSKGYTKGNVQLVCCALNVAKSNWPQDDFIELCRKVVDHAERGR